MKRLALLTAVLISTPALATPEYPILQLRVNMKNLVVPPSKGVLGGFRARQLAGQINEVWAQCGIHFELQTILNQDPSQLGVPFPPRNMDDLSAIDSKMYPNGFGGTIPITIAGPWNFSNGSVFLNGIGWQFSNGAGGVSKIGAMMNANRLEEPLAGLILAHELGHALSLPEGNVQDGTLMGTGTSKVSAEQCQQTRAFAQANLAEFTIGQTTKSAAAPSTEKSAK